uniref:Putative alcohol dehydrogenase transcription factor myb/sant-like protein n=1 Tax=Anopheles darlingi TaxID=43151 RepID=A0A2M4CIX7_ANODA
MGPTKVTQDDQQFNIDFVGAVKKHFCLFDSNSPEYKQAVMQDKAWQAVSQEVGESVDTCKKRWRNLRCCMTRYLKSVRDNTDLAANGRRKPYYLYNYMKFVIPYLKVKDENVSSYEYEDPPWAKPNSSAGGSKDASNQGEEEDEDDEVEDGPMHEIETIDVNEEEDPNQQELKQSIIQSIKIIGQQPQTSSEQQQQQQQQPQQPQQITISDTSTAVAPANTTTTTYEIFTGPPVKQARLSSSSSNCDAINSSNSHTATIKKELLNARQFITLTAAATSTPNTTAVPVFHSPTIATQHHQLTPVPANFAQQASDAQLHQQQQQQQHPTTQQFTFLPSTAQSQIPCDADHNFFQSLIPDILSMTMEQKRKLKIGILQLIDNILNV